MLNKEGEDALSSETRNSVIGKLIDIGSSDSKAAEQVVILFLELAERDILDIKPFLNGEKRKILLRNYRNFASKNTSQKGRKEFEKQLTDN